MSEKEYDNLIEYESGGDFFESVLGGMANNISSDYNSESETDSSSDTESTIQSYTSSIQESPLFDSDDNIEEEDNSPYINGGDTNEISPFLSNNENNDESKNNENNDESKKNVNDLIKNMIKLL